MRGMNALPAVLEENLDAIRALCEKYRVKRLAVFGSAVKGTFDPERSEVDFVVEFQLPGHFQAYFELKSALEQLFRRQVDLVEMNAVENPYFRRSVEAAQHEIYAAA